ncbi:MAG: methionyl-tRNA formyltransferase [Gallionellaceae bacterium]|nr:MAG: methionyl-tRNA formyltransferase [Gallionellaceae bacterium]
MRAYNPFPVAHTLFAETPLKILQATALDEPGGSPGTVLKVEKNGIVVACGKGALRLEVLQRPNAKAMPVAQLVQGFAVKTGDRFN